MPDNRVLKEILFGTVAGRSYKGKPRKHWIDDILKWSGMSLYSRWHTVHKIEINGRVAWLAPTVLEPRDKTTTTTTTTTLADSRLVNFRHSPCSSPHKA